MRIMQRLFSFLGLALLLLFQAGFILEAVGHPAVTPGGLRTIVLTFVVLDLVTVAALRSSLASRAQAQEPEPPRFRPVSPKFRSLFRGRS